jgi:hypothetical protein
MGAAASRWWGTVRGEVDGERWGTQRGGRWLGDWEDWQRHAGVEPSRVGCDQLVGGVARLGER